MTDTDIRDVLLRATDGLSPRADLLDDVRRGGHDRVVSRRRLLGGGLAAVATLSAGGVWWRRDGGSELTGSWLLDRPTRGDLATNERYLRQVRAAWHEAHGTKEEQAIFVGAVHVVWAGTTPAGPAAFVAQEYTNAAAPLSMAVAFIEPTADGPKAAGGNNITPGDPSTVCPRAILLGSSRDVLLLLDTGDPIRWSASLRYTKDGRVVREYTPVSFTDGAAVLSVPPQGPQISIGLLSGTDAEPTRVAIANAVEIEIATKGSAGGDGMIFGDLPDPRKVWPADTERARAAAAAWVAGPMQQFLDPGGYEAAAEALAWEIQGGTPDGRRLVIRTPSGYDGSRRLLAFLGRPGGRVTVVRGDDLQPSDVPSVALRLPDEQGVVVAGDYITLRYRTARSGWLPVKGEVALLPAAATRIEVTPKGGGTAVERDLP